MYDIITEKYCKVYQKVLKFDIKGRITIQKEAKENGFFMTKGTRKNNQKECYRINVNILYYT